MRAAYALRPAADADRELLRSIYASVREEERARIECTDQQWSEFIDQQFEAQDADYRRNNPSAEFMIVEVEGRAAGRLYVRREAARIHLIDIALLPEFRNQGLGSRIFRDLMSEAAERGRTVSIYVEEHNPARRLYERLGFLPVESHGLYLLMQWSDGER